jgi:nucleoid-associated protein YgaU
MIENPEPTARLRAKVLAATVAAVLSGAMLFGASVAAAAETDPIAGARGDYDAAAGTYTVGAGDNLSAIAKRFGIERRRAGDGQ